MRATAASRLHRRDGGRSISVYFGVIVAAAVAEPEGRKHCTTEHERNSAPECSSSGFNLVESSTRKEQPTTRAPRIGCSLLSDSVRVASSTLVANKN